MYIYMNCHETKSFAVFVQYLLSCFASSHSQKHPVFIYDNVKNWVKLTKNMFGSYFTPKPKFIFSSLPFYFIFYGILFYKNNIFLVCMFVLFLF